MQYIFICSYIHISFFVWLTHVITCYFFLFSTDFLRLELVSPCLHFDFFMRLARSASKIPKPKIIRLSTSNGPTFCPLCGHCPHYPP